MKTQKYQLKNGLRVILLESHKSPVVSVQMWVKTGSADEPEKVAGISHFIEHLVFKGTKSYRVGEIASSVEAAGGQLNAYTSFDETVFYVTISNAFAETALKVVAEMMGSPLFDAQEIDNEREVVIEEIKRGLDSPASLASQQMFNSVFKKHNYGRPVIGFDSVIKKVSPKQIKDYFEARYSPENMFLVVSGAFNPVQMKKEIQQHYGDFKRTRTKKIIRKQEPKQKNFRMNVQQGKFQDTISYLSWRAPQVDHKDIPALDILALIAGQGESSRLFQRLRLEKPLVNSVGAFAYTPKDPGLFAISMSGGHENFVEALRVIEAEIQKLKSETVTEQEMQKALNLLASDEVYSIETVDGIARKAGALQLSFGDPEYFVKYMKQLYKVTPSDILKVAQKYLKAETLTASVLIQKNEDSAVKKNIEKALKAFAVQLKKQKVNTTRKIKKYKTQKLVFHRSDDKHTPQVISYQMDGGFQLFVRKQSETPTVSLRTVFHGGSRCEDQEQAGMTEIFSRIWSSETQNRTEAEIGHLIDFNAAAVSSFSGRNTFGLNADFLSSFQGNILPLVKDILLRPKFSSSLIEREKHILKNQIRMRNDNPGQITMMNFMDKMFAGHPYAADVLGSDNSHKKITTATMEKYFSRMFSVKKGVMSIVGDVDPDKVASWASEIISLLPKDGHVDDLVPPNKLVKDFEVFHEMDKEQSHIVMGYRGLSIASEEKYILQVMQSILAGQGGRLFVELRDKKSLAYSVSPMRMEGLGCGYFGAYIGCSPEKAELAIKMMEAEFIKLTKEKVSSEELARAKKFIVGKHDISLQRKSAVCNSIAFDAIYGLSPEESLLSAAKINKVTAEDIINVARSLFLAPKVTSVVGKQNPF